jgi:hypothetical protein
LYKNNIALEDGTFLHECWGLKLLHACGSMPFVSDVRFLTGSYCKSCHNTEGKPHCIMRLAVGRISSHRQCDG